MLVPIEKKVEVLDAILADDGEGMFPDWDGTFEGLHEFCDANMYLEPLLSEGYDIEALNEVIEYLQEAFKRLAEDLS